MNKKRIYYRSLLILFCIFANIGLEASWLTKKKRTRRHHKKHTAQHKNHINKKIDAAFNQLDLKQADNQTRMQLAQAESPRQISKEQQIAKTRLTDQDRDALQNINQLTSDIQEKKLKSEEKIKKLEKEGIPKTAINEPTQLNNTNMSHEDITKQEEEEARIELNFENADLRNLLKQAEAIFDITFITDDSIEPIRQGGKAIKGNKISFKTHKPLTRTQAWNLVVTFLDIAGFGVVQQADPTIYRVKKYEDARQSALPAFIGMDPDELPSNDEIIRYVYFIKNSTVKALQPIIESLRSREAGFVVLQENKAFILTDRAYNVRTLMRIVRELDKVTTPQAMSVLKLRRAEAKDVEKLYQSLMQNKEGAPRPRFFGRRKEPTSLYFPEGTQVIAEPRTNSLILLGQQDAIKQIEDFIIKHVDVELDQPYSPLHVYDLKYANAVAIAQIMNNVTKFESNKPAARAGGVRGGDKFLKPMSFTAEPSTNQLIIQGNYEDYMTAKKIIDEIDQPQPQVAVEVLILAVDINDTKQLGTQIRSKEPGPEGFLGKNVKFQTGNLGNRIVENSNATVGVQRLLGDLITLATGQNPGSTLLTLGQDIFGVWGVLKMLKTVSNVQVVSNPFLVATNKTPAKVSLGETRRVNTAQVAAVQVVDAQGNEDANLSVEVTPQINDDGMIVLGVKIGFDQFTSTDPTSATKTTREINTKTIVANKEVLALGGLIKNKIQDSARKTPFLHKIPIFGWLFKNEAKAETKTSLLILISSRILTTEKEQITGRYTQDRIASYHGYINEMDAIHANHDPIHRSFFMDKENSTSKLVDNFIFKEQAKRKKERQEKKKTIGVVNNTRRRRRRGRRRKKQKTIIAQNEPQRISPYIAQPVKVAHMNHNKSDYMRKHLAPPPPIKKVQPKIKTKNLRSRINKQKKSKILLEDLLSNNEAELT